MNPLELLHPDGFARAPLVLGDCPPRLRPTAEPDDAIVVVLERGASTNELRGRGLQETAVLLHLPDLETSSRVVALHGPALRYALSDRTSLRGRLASGVARLRFGPAVLGKAADTSTVFVRPGEVPLNWFKYGELNDVVIDTSWHGDVSTSVLRVVRNGVLDKVAKVGAGPSVEPPGLGEAEGLRTLGPAAAAAGFVVPSVLDELLLDGTPVTTESAVPGEPAAELIARHPSTAGDFIERLTTHLGKWNEATATAQPLVAVHQDLTMANVLVDGEQLGLVDWASSRPDGLPLTDFFYAVVDARAAVDGYRDRVRALNECFARTGDWFTRVAGLEVMLAERLGIDRATGDAAFHACWTHHAANEQRRGESGQFRAVLEAARGLR